jgi:hypothetical protein
MPGDNEAPGGGPPDSKRQAGYDYRLSNRARKARIRGAGSVRCPPTQTVLPTSSRNIRIVSLPAVSTDNQSAIA